MIKKIYVVAALSIVLAQISYAEIDPPDVHDFVLDYAESLAVIAPALINVYAFTDGYDVWQILNPEKTSPRPENTPVVP